MKRRRNNSGFTLAEVLITVAIIMILAGVAFVAVQRQQRSLTRVEFDSMAKEIYIAAQNHFKAAESQGYLGLKNNDYGTRTDVYENLNLYGTVDGENERVVYYISSSDGSQMKKDLSYAIDDIPGCYIICYQPAAAKVLDVFYSDAGRSVLLTAAGTNSLGADGDYSLKNLMEKCRGDDKASTRNRYGNENAVVGWYGDFGENGKDTVLPEGKRLDVPTIEIINAEKLLVKVTDPNSAQNSADQISLKLIIEDKNKAKWKHFPLIINGGNFTPDSDNRISYDNNNKTYTVILDDITNTVKETGLHFASIVAETGSDSFIPGEDIVVKVVAYNNTKLSNVAMSEPQITNSLFANPGTDTNQENAVIDGSDVEKKLAGIANIRHLENLGGNISNVNNKTTPDITDAVQLTDLDWEDFKSKVTDNQKYTENGSTTVTTLKIIPFPVNTSSSTELPKQAGPGSYLPPIPPKSINYNGRSGDKNHIVKGITVNGGTDTNNNVTSFSGNAGLFSELPSGSSVKNLELLDFNITGVNSGALAGSIEYTTVTNVIARNSDASTDKTITSSSVSSSSESSAGGLIGTMTNGRVEYSAAALIVSSDKNAGGLIGSISGATATVSGCFSGGHTDKAEYYNHDANGNRTNPIWNVTGVTFAGGLIGDAGTARIENSYSTCSVNGSADTTKAGGFAGRASSGSINNCYCTGLVYPEPNKTDNTTVVNNAFIGSGTPTSVSNCSFYEIINEVKLMDGSKVKEIVYKEPGYDGVSALDANAETYEKFVGKVASITETWTPSEKWKPSTAYDSTLVDYYTGRYNLKTVEQLKPDATLPVKTDETTPVTYYTWDELFVARHYGDWPAPEIFVFNSAS